MTRRFTHECGCEIVVYGDDSAPPDIEYCDYHGEQSPQTRIFELVLIGGDSNRKKAVEMILRLSREGRRHLGNACRDLDSLIDEAWIEETRQKYLEERRGK
jgi:hypothetical protein